MQNLGCPWILPGLFAHLLRGSVEALLGDAGGYWSFTYISSNPTSRLPPDAVSPCQAEAQEE